MFSRRLVQKAGSAALRSNKVISTSRQQEVVVGLRSFSAVVEEPPLSDLSASYIELEDKYGAHNYHRELYLRCVIMKYYKMLLYYANAIYTLFMHRATQQSSSYSILNTL